MKTFERLSNGKLPRASWPGCYPLFYATKDGGILCPDCANGENGSEAKEGHEDPQWNIVDQGVFWEGPPMTCDHCHCRMESAYGSEMEQVEQLKLSI